MSRRMQPESAVEEYRPTSGGAGRQMAVAPAGLAACSVPHGPHPSRQKAGNPPVLIMNMFYSGLGIARAMAGRGVRVIGLSADRAIYGNFTRLCAVRFAPDSHEQPEELAEYLLSAASEWRGAVIFPTRDFDVLFLDRFRAELTPSYRLAIPPRACLAQTLDKAALAAVARLAGVPTPRALRLSSEEELDKVPGEIGLPCVVKAVRSTDWREGDNWEKVGARKGFLVNSREELRREYRRIRRACLEVLLQEWIPGCADRLVAIGAYVGARSEPLAYFTARKLVQSPLEFGTGCVVRSEEIPELLPPTRRLWKALQYQGMAEVEYKHDPRTGEYRLIEMNTRHWDQHELGCASGINLTWTAYCDLTAQPVPAHTRRTACATWIAEDAFLYQLLKGWHQKPERVKLPLAQLSAPRIYGIFSWRDPLPMVNYLCRKASGSGTWAARRIGKRFRKTFSGEDG